MGNREKEQRAGQNDDTVWFIFAEILLLLDPIHPKQRATKALTQSTLRMPSSEGVENSRFLRLKPLSK